MGQELGQAPEDQLGLEFEQKVAQSILHPRRDHGSECFGSHWQTS